MALTDLVFKPGFNTDNTDRGAGQQGYWKGGDKVRFYAGQPTKLGGWQQVTSGSTFLGYARGSADVRTELFQNFVVFGTEKKLYVWDLNTVYDITPYRETGTLGADPFTTTNGLTAVSVADNSHGLELGDYVNFSGASTFAGITISGAYTVTNVTSANAYVITHSAPANASTTGGGAVVAYAYELPVGIADSTPGLGWGAGPWGEDLWGTPRTVTGFYLDSRVWSVDLWGYDVVASPRFGGIYVWDSSAGVTSRATLISQAPTTCRGILVSPEDRHLIAFGAHDGSTDDPMLVRWCDQENYTDWTPTVTNTAGSKRLDLGNSILMALKVRGEHLLYTDSALYSMTFVGPPDTFAFRPVGDNGNLVGPMAGHVFEGIAYWMSDKDFFTYDGTIRAIECPVAAHVYDDFNSDQKVKVQCGVNRDYREVWWVYPSADSYECDRYVMYSIPDKTWVFGTLDRTMIVGDSDIINQVYAFGADNKIYWHEVGTDDDGEAMEAYIDSGDVELAPAGANLMHMGEFVPDFKTLEGSVQITFTGKKRPQATETTVSGPHTVTSTTELVNPRVRARQLSIRIESSDIGDDWRVGTLRADLISHGGR